MQTVKEDVNRILSNLPDDCTYEDVQYHLYVIQKVERGRKDKEAGRVYSQEEMEQRMSKWLGK